MAIRIEPRDPLTQAQGVEAGYAQTARRWPSQPLVRRPLGVAELSGPQQLARRLPPAGGGKAGDLAGYGHRLSAYASASTTVSTLGRSARRASSVSASASTASRGRPVTSFMT